MDMLNVDLRHRWTCLEGSWVWSLESGRGLGERCGSDPSVHIRILTTAGGVTVCGVGIPVPRGWGDVRKQTSGQGGGRKPGLMASGSRAGVTTCVCLSWASSPASGGPWPSSAGSVTEPSVSCCRPSTSPTCTACGKPCTLLRLRSPSRCPGVPREQGSPSAPPLRHCQTFQKQQKLLSKAEWAPGSWLSQNKKT